MIEHSRYDAWTEEQKLAATWRAKRAMGNRVVILGHHYQNDQVIQFADFRGDSLELSRRAADVRDAQYIVFCGVYFMAETAAVLCAPEQIVIQPQIEATCPMALMASSDDVPSAWAALSSLWDGDLIPITYQNSTIDVKAFVGRQGGAVCTSANAAKMFRWAFEHAGHLLFVPDEHLGTNTALAMHISREEIGLWDPFRGTDAQTLQDCRVVVWRGHCYVHSTFRPEDVDKARQEYPGCLVVVHPECTHEVVAKADLSGSTTAIIRAVEQAPSGSTIIIGTEWNLVNRLQHEHPDKHVIPLRVMKCKNMGMTSVQDLLHILDNLREGQALNVVQVDSDTAAGARMALQTMLQVG
jgi:quinolinate synthase